MKWYWWILIAVLVIGGLAVLYFIYNSKRSKIICKVNNTPVQGGDVYEYWYINPPDGGVDFKITNKEYAEYLADKDKISIKHCK